VQYAIDAGDDIFAPDLRHLLGRACRIGRRRDKLADAPLKTYAARLESRLDELMARPPTRAAGVKLQRVIKKIRRHLSVFVTNRAIPATNNGSIKGRYAVTTQNNIVKFAEPGAFEDPLTVVLRSGARKLLADAVEAEVSDFLDRHSRFLTEEGQQRLVRRGHLPEREIMTGIGPVGVRAPRVRDRVGQGEARIRFSSAFLPPYARRSKSLEVLIPILYLKGISTRDFEETLAALLGKDAGGLSASTVARLKDAWVDEHAYRTKPLSPWSSSLLKRLRNIGGVSMDKANCQRSFTE